MGSILCNMNTCNTHLSSRAARDSSPAALLFYSPLAPLLIAWCCTHPSTEKCDDPTHWEI